MTTLLLDTHVLLWAAGSPERLSVEATDLLDDRRATLLFSTVSIWEVSIKNRLGRVDFQVDPGLLRRGLLMHGYVELAVSGAHAVATGTLPMLHRDPFDRMLVAQAQVEAITLVTADATVAQYPGSIKSI